MAIAGASNLAASQAEFAALLTQMLSAQPQGFAYELAAQRIGTDGKYVRNPVITSLPMFRQWTGSKAYKDLRAYEQTITIGSYERTVSLDRLDVVTDRSGVVQAALNAFSASTKQAVDKLMIDRLSANTWTGYDGVSLLNDAHPNTNSTGDNLITSALSFTNYRDLRAVMRKFSDEDGALYNVTPTHVMVGADQERIALEIAGASRPVAVSNAGAYDGTSNIVGATTIPNVFGGSEVTIIVNDLVTGNKWFMMDLSKPVKPIVWCVLRAPEAISQDGGFMQGDQRFTYDRFNYSIEGDWEFGAGAWMLIAGSVT